MPKISIQTLPLDDKIEIPQVLKRLGKELSRALNISPKRLAILWDYIKPDHFLFNGELARTQEKKTHHPIVDVTAVRGMPAHLEVKMISTIVCTLSRELQVDEDNICVVINTLAPGKLFVAGRFVKGSAGTN
jgi:phenylpyruvate tautomerase PptA (4-oxalocrotonate tautomerase family)